MSDIKDLKKRYEAVYGRLFETEPDCWVSYADFFSYLLDREGSE